MDQFLLTNQDQAFYEKIGVPAPKLSPRERERRRFAFRNERTLYRRACDLCKASIISIYHSDTSFPVYCHTCWWSDRCHPESFGRDFDYSKPFFSQFQKLLLIVPRVALYNINSINSDYCQQIYGDKNCYLCFAIKGCEDCMYLSHCFKNKDCLDCYLVHESELCYECLSCEKLYNSTYCEHCHNSNYLAYCYDLSGCQDCFGCSNLRKKQYFIFNKPYSKKAYIAYMQSLSLNRSSEREKIAAQFEELKKNAIHRALWNVNTEQSTGNNLQNAKNACVCYDAFDIEDCGYCSWIFRLKDCYDCYGVGDSELIYEGLGVEEVNRCFFNTFTTNSSLVHYSDSCFSSRNLFGCVGLKSQSYCILNKKYPKDEFERVQSKIVEYMKQTGEYGEFFPMRLSPFSYNETIAQDFYPISKEEARSFGSSWRDLDEREYQKQTFIIPDSINEISDSITQNILACSVTGKNYKILPQELSFYRRMGLPIPRKSPEQRMKERIGRKNPRILYNGTCAQCRMDLVSPYATDREKNVFCEDCYLKVLY